LTAAGGLTGTTGYFSDTLTAAGGITANGLTLTGPLTGTTACFANAVGVTGLLTAAGGITGTSGYFGQTLTAAGGLTGTTGYFSDTLTAAGGITVTSGQTLTVAGGLTGNVPKVYFNQGTGMTSLVGPGPVSLLGKSVFTGLGNMSGIAIITTSGGTTGDSVTLSVTLNNNTPGPFTQSGATMFISKAAPNNLCITKPFNFTGVTAGTTQMVSVYGFANSGSTVQSIQTELLVYSDLNVQ
jgi:hypothetical protein